MVGLQIAIMVMCLIAIIIRNISCLSPLPIAGPLPQVGNTLLKKRRRIHSEEEEEEEEETLQGGTKRVPMAPMDLLKIGLTRK